MRYFFETTEAVMLTLGLALILLSPVGLFVRKWGPVRFIAPVVMVLTALPLLGEVMGGQPSVVIAGESSLWLWERDRFVPREIRYEDLTGIETRNIPCGTFCTYSVYLHANGEEIFLLHTIPGRKSGVIPELAELLGERARLTGPVVASRENFAVWKWVR